MESLLKDWIREQLFPSLWEIMPTAFPEREFWRSGERWYSPTYLDGTKHPTDRDKTWVSSRTIWLLHEQGGGKKSLVDCYMEVNGLSFGDALRQLASLAGLRVPKSEGFDYQAWRKEKERLSLREAAQEYFTWCLLEGKSSRAKEILEYLEQKRGYTEEEIKWMGLGYIPSQDKLKEKLLSLGFTDTQIKDTLNLTSCPGNTHPISIPIYTAGELGWFLFRQIGDGDNLQYPNLRKYDAEQGIDRGARLCYISPLKGDKDLVVVEGELDALAAAARGVENVVAIGGSGFSLERAAHAIKMGARSFTLCLDLDNEEKKKEETRGKVEKAINCILQAGCPKIYIATLPELEEEPTKTDADTLIKYKGVDAFRKVIREAQPWWGYELTNLYNEFARKEKEDGTLSQKQIEALLDRMLQEFNRIPDRVAQDRFLHAAEKVFAALGIKQESFFEVADGIEKARKKEQEKNLLKRTLTRANALQEEGKIEEAETLLRDGLNTITEETNYQDFASITQSTSLQVLKEKAAAAPDSIGIGYEVQGREIVFAGGALSVVAAPTSHGKTTFLLNVLLNLALDRRYQGKKWVLLSYEEPATRVYQYLLNIYLNAPLNQASQNKQLVEEYFKTNTKPQYMSEDGYNLLKRAEDEFFNKKRIQERILVVEPGYNSEQIAAYIDYLGRRGDIGGLFVDYFQCLKAPLSSGKRTMSRQEELKEICYTLNDASKSSGLPIILAAQFNREVVTIDMLHPTKVREAADIEQIAHTLLGLWDCSKKELLNDKSKAPATSARAMIEGKASGLYLEVLKSRIMRAGDAVVLDYNGNLGKISNPAAQVKRDGFQVLTPNPQLSWKEEEDYQGD